MTAGAELTAAHQLFLEELGKAGGSIGNVALRRRLRWSQKRYDRVREDLLASHLTRGGGRGGSISIRPDAAPLELDDILEEKESGLYAPLQEALPRWEVLAPCAWKHVDTIATRRSRGKWRRPDLVAVAVERVDTQHVPGVHVVLHTIEVKTWSGLDVTSVFEAVQQSRDATYGWLLVQVPAAIPSDSGLPEVERLCLEHGIGLVLVRQPSQPDQWETRCPARRRPVTSDELDSACERHLSDEIKVTLRQAWSTLMAGLLAPRQDPADASDVPGADVADRVGDRRAMPC